MSLEREDSITSHYAGRALLRALKALLTQAQAADDRGELPEEFTDDALDDAANAINAATPHFGD